MLNFDFYETQEEMVEDLLIITKLQLEAIKRYYKILEERYEGIDSDFAKERLAKYKKKSRYYHFLWLDFKYPEDGCPDYDQDKVFKIYVEINQEYSDMVRNFVANGFFSKEEEEEEYDYYEEDEE